MLMDQTTWDFLLQQSPQLLLKVSEQIYLATAATLIAILLGMPLGIIAAQFPKFKHLSLGFANVLQTIPSLALLAFLLPFLGIGVKPALIALAAYALLPIMRNTVVALDNTPQELVEAADGLGFTAWQKLSWVELPLAFPLMIAGIRTAMAMSIGIATLAAFIGAGGLGDFIYQGLVLNDNRLILLGAIPAALLALVLDYLLGKIEKQYVENKVKPAKKNLFWPWFLISFIIIGSASGFILKPLLLQGSINNRQDTIKIATKNSTEQLILGEILAQLISAKTQLKVERFFNLGSTAICHRALMSGEIDLYPEYTGTAYQVVLGQKEPRTPEGIFQSVAKAYQQQFHIIWLSPLGFNNTQALIVRQDFAAKNHLKKISDLMSLAPTIAIGVRAEFLQRPDGYPGLQGIYGLKFADIKIMNPGLMYMTLRENNLAAIVGDSTDGRILAYQLQILEDDKHVFPAYYAAPIIREDLLIKHPEIRDVLALLSQRITNKMMAQLNAKVDLEHQSPATVAQTFLQQQGLLK